MSRPLPNTFATVLTNLAFSFSFEHQHDKTIALLAISSIIFRCDTVVLAVPFILVLLFQRKVSFLRFFVCGFLSSIASILFTVLVDSFFWNKWIWPEFVVLWFNSVENRSSEWGISPFHWYFSNAIPRSLMLLVFFFPFSILQSYLRQEDTKKPFFKRISLDVLVLWLIVLSYVCLYSILLHKELRFIFPAVYVLVCLGALGLDRFCSLAPFRLTRQVLIPAVLFINLIGALFFLHASSWNYPGGVLFARMHSRLRSQSPSLPSVHICNLAAISGVSRFGEMPDMLLYDKNESVNHASDDRFRFDLLISEHNRLGGFVQTDFENAFVRISSIRIFGPVKIHVGIITKPVLFLHQKNSSYKSYISTVPRINRSTLHQV
jgi:alpha-1,6-mannosyltransferase